MKLDNITSPELLFRAVHKETGNPIEFTIGQVKYDKRLELVFAHVVDGKNDLTPVKLSDCHKPDLWTGHVDSEGTKVFGADVWRVYNGDRSLYEDFLIEWNREQGCWNKRWLRKPHEVSSFTARQASNGTIIGNIHNVEALPDEVSKILSEAK